VVVARGHGFGPDALEEARGQRRLPGLAGPRGFLLALPRRHGLVDLLEFDVRKTLREFRRYV